MGPIGVSLNGVPFYNQYAGGGAPLSNEINSFDQYNVILLQEEVVEAEDIITTWSLFGLLKIMAKTHCWGFY